MQKRFCDICKKEIIKGIEGITEYRITSSDAKEYRVVVSATELQRAAKDIDICRKCILKAIKDS